MFDKDETLPNDENSTNPVIKYLQWVVVISFSASDIGVGLCLHGFGLAGSLVGLVFLIQISVPSIHIIFLTGFCAARIDFPQP